MLNIENIILKYDLNYSLSEEEKSFISLLDSEEIVKIRKNILYNIKSTKLPLDVLEEKLEKLKNEEYNKYVNGILETDDLKKKEVELEKAIYSMIINIAKGNANCESLSPKNDREHECEKVSHK